MIIFYLTGSLIDINNISRVPQDYGPFMGHDKRGNICVEFESIRMNWKWYHKRNCFKKLSRGLGPIHTVKSASLKSYFRFHATH